MDYSKVLVTGGSGLLGSEIRYLIPRAFFPTRNELDVKDYASIEKYISEKDINCILHLAAFTSPPKIDQNPLEALESNIVGTANITKVCIKKNIRLIYISTDYVFKGDRGDYSEDDELYPINKYAWSKLGGECAARLYNDSLIVRTSFSQNEFPYEGAFIDQWTSREKVSEIAKKIITIVDNEKLKGIIHIGGKRMSVFEYANHISPEKNIKRISIKEVNFDVPKDTSLNCGRYLSIFKEGLQ